MSLPGRVRQFGLRSDRALFTAIVAPLIVLYSLTATWVPPYHGDALTNVVTAWYIGNTGSPIVSEHGAVAVREQRGNFSWIVPSPRGPVSQYPPGAALLAAPVYALSRQPMVMTQQVGSNRPDLPPVDFPMPPIWPAAVVAILSTAVAMGFLALTFAQMGSRRDAWVGAMVAGLGTAAWSVASDMLWQHGPAMLWVSIGAHLVSRGRLEWAGAAFGLGVLTRPHIAFIAAATGIGLSIAERSLRPILALGPTSALGLAALLLYNRWLLGIWSISGAYGGGFSDGFVNNTTGWFARNVWGGLFDLSHGLIMWSPILLVLAVGVVKGAKSSSPWVAATAIGGALYLLVQWRANRFSGGEGHFSYRYPLEAMAAWAPLLFAGYQTRITSNPRLRRMFWFAAAASIMMHAYGAIRWPAILID